MNGSVWLVQLSNVGVTDVGGRGKAEKGSASGGEPRGCRLGPKHLLDPSPLLLPSPSPFFPGAAPIKLGGAVPPRSSSFTLSRSERPKQLNGLPKSV